EALLAAKEPAPAGCEFTPWSSVGLGRRSRAYRDAGDDHPNTWKAALRICHPFSAIGRFESLQSPRSRMASRAKPRRSYNTRPTKSQPAGISRPPMDG